MVDDRKSFIQGIGWAIAQVVDMADEPTIANNIMKESGYSLGDFVKVCDEQDFPALKKTWEN